MKARVWIAAVAMLTFAVCSLDAQDDISPSAINNIQGLAWSPSDASLAMAGIIDNEAGVWLSNNDTHTTFRLQTPESLFNMLSVAWSPDGSKVAGLASGEIYTYYIWDIPTGNLIARVEQEGETSDFSIYWSPDGTKLATVAGFTVFVRNGTTGQVLTTLREVASNTDTVEAVAWSMDEENLSVASGDNMIRVWDTDSTTKISEFSLSHRISSIALSPDGAALAVGGDIGSIHALDAATGIPLYTLQSSINQRASFVEWNPIGGQVVSADIRGNIAIWDTNTQQIVDTLGGNSAEILQDIAYSPYGGRLAYSRRSMDEGQSTQLSAEVATQTVANDAVHIIVPAPSLERLQAIADACNAPTAIDQALTSVQADQLTEFVAQVEALPEDTIPPACAADLIAVALQSR
jgi:WD40 repeat protein